jgi:hypothetical protein
MAGDIAMDFDRLRQHAAFVDSLAGDLTSAVSALRGGNLEDAAFGILCAFLVPPSMAMTAAASGLFGADVSLMTRTAAELRATADQWERFEDDVVVTLRDIEGTLA